MALKKGSTSTRVSSNQAENNQAEEKNNATTGMMAEMKNMFDEKL